MRKALLVAVVIAVASFLVTVITLGVLEHASGPIVLEESIRWQ